MSRQRWVIEMILWHLRLKKLQNIKRLIAPIIAFAPIQGGINHSNCPDGCHIKVVMLSFSLPPP